MDSKFSIKHTVIIVLLVSLWVHVSEVFRYFIFETPYLRAFLQPLPDIAPMSLGIFSVWGGWDTLLTFDIVLLFWLYAQKYGNNQRSVIVSALLAWLTFPLLFWWALPTMGMAPLSLLLLTLPLNLVECMVATWIASALFRKLQG